ncbi:MAG: retropepsin-like aspartic protease [Planctomycetota bacterium]
MTRYFHMNGAAVGTLCLLALLACTGMSCPAGISPIPATITIPDGASGVSGQDSRTRLFVVSATINGQGPYAMIVDTGAAVTTVSSKIGNLLPKTPLVFGVQGVGGTVEKVSTVQIDALVMGSMEFKSFFALVIDIPLFAERSIDGIIGASVFHDVTLMIDYPSRTLRVETTPLAQSTCNIPIKGGDLGPQNTYSVPSININVAGQIIDVFIDSGSENVLDLPSTYSTLPFVGPLNTTTTSGVAGSQTNQVGTLNGDVIVACKTYKSPTVHLGGSLAAVGSGGWQKTIFSLDQRSKLMRLETPGCAPNQDCIEETGYRVYEVALPLIEYSGQLEVLEAGSELEPYRLCDFWGGGPDCTTAAVLVPLTDIFPTREEAVLSLCPRITNLHDIPFFAFPIASLDGITKTLSFGVLNIIGGCP